MRSRLLLALLLPALMLAGSGISWLAIYGFWVGIWLFRSVTAARFIDSVGKIVLLPARCFLWVFTGLDNPAIPLFAPTWYVVINGALLGSTIYILIRTLLFRRPK